MPAVQDAQLLRATGSRSNDRAAEADLVAIGVPIDRLARLVGIGDQLIRLDAARRDIRNACVEVVEEDGMDRPPGALALRSSRRRVRFALPLYARTSV